MPKSTALLALFFAPPTTSAKVIPLTAHPRQGKARQAPAELAGMLKSLQRLRMQLKHQLEPALFAASLPAISTEDYFDLRRMLTGLVVQLARLNGDPNWNLLMHRTYEKIRRQYLKAFVLARYYLRVSQA